MLYIGVDLGTSALKLLLMRGDGTIENIVSREYPISFPQSGWSEQDPKDWWDACVSGIRELTQNVDKSQVAGISFGGQMHGLVVLDDKDEVIRPVILWNDGRTAEETDYLNVTVGRQKLSEYTANIAFAGFTAPKLLWMKKHEPDLFAKIAKIMLPKDYLAYKLTGVHCTDVSDASGMLLMDVKRKCWSKEMLSICEIQEGQLARIYESYEKVGTLLPEAARQGRGITRPQQSAPGRWGMEAATFPLGQAARYLFPVTGLRWIKITRSMHLPTRTGIIT